jgi:predicted lipid-binding transport protein (Tim44 family)
MKKAAALFAVVLAVGMSLALDAEARRLGGARSSGMQRQAVTAPATPPAGTAQRAPAQAAPATAPAAGTAAAAAGKRSWMGPIAGLAAGLGIAALASHFGFGEALANMLTIALIAVAVLALIGFVMRKRAAAQGAPFGGAPAGAPAGMFRTGEPQPQAQGGSLIGSRIGSGLAAPAVGGPVPAGFDVEGFVRKAKTQFLLLQAANDAGDLQRLRDYLTPEMYDVVRAEVEARPAGVQRTEVFGLEAQVLEAVEEPAQYVVSVRFTGSVREQPGAVPEDLDEVWHLTKPRAGAGGWVIAGIQQAAQ